ncbi:DUF998 domain-containing protein [Neobacillus sp. SCS-31]|uniref:DUF998 domain-containing protein n=1 Tax=Neobacillus oceani TaxID=3115292 RepID=UPI003905DE63
MMETSLEHRKNTVSEINRLLALGAVTGPILFSLAYTILGFLRPDFSAVSEPISGLGVGTNAPAMNASFILMGLLLFVGVIGIFQNMKELGNVARWACIILLELSPIGCIICGLYTYEFTLHFVGFFLACGTPVISYLVVGLLLRRVSIYRRIGSWLILGSPLTLILIYMFMASFDYLNTDVGVAGLIERILIIEVHAYYVILGWLVFRRKSR